MSSVQRWAEQQNFHYRFLDDHFFSIVPETYREHVNGQRHLLADYARLLWSQKFLVEGWNQVIWVDADVLITNLQYRLPRSPANYLFSQEIWLEQTDSEILAYQRINNAVMMFQAANPFLHFYIHACEQMATTRSGRLNHTDVGTTLLTHMLKPLKTPLIKGLGMLSPLLLNAYNENQENVIKYLEKKVSASFWAFNLCLTFRNTDFHTITISDELYENVIKELKMRYSD